MPDERAQITKVIGFFRGRKLTREAPPFKTAVEWLQHLQTLPHLAKGFVELRKELLDTVCDTFDISEAELLGQVTGVALVKLAAPERSSEQELLDALPKGGWLDWYAQYTMKTESPLSYHLFCSLCCLGAALGRRVYKSKGFFKIFPNFCVVLVGPPARVAKTSAVDIAKHLIKENALCPVMADKVTPEALSSSLVGQGGHHFICAPEMSFLFGKQKYNEGLTVTFLRLLDSPDQIEISTIGRGKETIHAPCITFLGASTMSLLTGSTPEQLTSSGFLSRLLLVIENDTEREFFEPEKGSDEIAAKINYTLQRMKCYQGEVTYSPAADLWARAEYSAFKKRIRTVTEDALAESLSRYAVHLERMAMLIHIAECDNLIVCDRCFQVAHMLMQYIERRMPQAIVAIRKTEASAETDRIVSLLGRLGGAAQHSTLLRRSNMSAAVFKAHIQTLEEQQVIRSEKRGLMQYYILTGGQ